MTVIPDFTSAHFLMDPLKKMLTKYGVFLWVGVTVVFALGFRLASPNERLATVEHRVTAIQLQVRADSEVRATMVRWMCVKSTAKEILLSGLKCN